MFFCVGFLCYLLTLFKYKYSYCLFSPPLLLEHEQVSPERVLTAAIGISAEGGEFAEIVKKCIFQGKPMDDDAQYHMKRELGDIMWYIAQACIALNISLEDVLDTNIQKLEARYPDGFEAFRSENRKEGDI